MEAASLEYQTGKISKEEREVKRTEYMAELQEAYNTRSQHDNIRLMEASDSRGETNQAVFDLGQSMMRGNAARPTHTTCHMLGSVLHCDSN